MKKSDIVKEYLDRFPNTPSNTLAKVIYSENKDAFADVESIRYIVRRFRGSAGEPNLKKITIDKYLTPEKRSQKYNIPKAIDIDYSPHLLNGESGLIFGDVHIPFHDEKAIETMLDATVKNKYDFVLIDGDLCDFYEISDFDKRPGVAKLLDELAMAKQFLLMLKKAYPKSRVILKASNHEARLERFICRKAPELYGLEAVRLENLLDLHNIGISYVDHDRYVDLSGLSILHGHELKFGGGKNPAASLYNATGVTSLCAHFHKTSEHSGVRLGREVDVTWTIGCLCQLAPEYARSNQWNSGYAEYKRLDENFWHVDNKKIIGGRVV